LAGLEGQISTWGEGERIAHTRTLQSIGITYSAPCLYRCKRNSNLQRERIAMLSEEEIANLNPFDYSERVRDGSFCPHCHEQEEIIHLDSDPGEFCPDNPRYECKVCGTAWS
jgi:hypothetical protein